MHTDRGSEDYGDWTVAIRDVAGFDYDRAEHLLDWPLRELILAFLHILKRDAWEEYKAQRLIYTLQSQWSTKVKPPKLPDILRDKPRQTGKVTLDPSTTRELRAE